MNTPIPILLVDDKPANLLVLESVLNSPGYRLVKARNAEEALREMLSTEFAVLVLDVKMPETSGLELAAMVHKRPSTQFTPIVFVSGHRVEGADAQAGYAAGGVDYITKPFDPTALRTKVGVFAELFRQRKNLAEENARLREALAQAQAAASAPKTETASAPAQ